jgi:hypothetical protein
MKKLQCQQTLVAGLHRAWLARAVAGLAVLSASDATAQPSAKPSDAEICDCVAQALAADIELARCYSLILEELAGAIYSTKHLVSRRRASRRSYSPRSMPRRHTRPIGV